MVDYNDLLSIKEYMESKGVRFTGGRADIGNAKGWAILGGKTSLRVLEDARDGINGIILFCYKDKEDCNRICSNLKIDCYANAASSDTTRPFKVQISPDKLDAAIDILLMNPLNKK